MIFYGSRGIRKDGREDSGSEEQRLGWATSLSPASNLLKFLESNRGRQCM